MVAKHEIKYCSVSNIPSVRNVGKANVTQLLRMAFKAWSDYSRLTFSETKDHGKADIVVAFGRFHHGDMYVKYTHPFCVYYLEVDLFPLLGIHLMVLDLPLPMHIILISTTISEVTSILTTTNHGRFNKQIHLKTKLISSTLPYVKNLDLSFLLFSFFDVIHSFKVHEIGHSLGLAHSSVQSSVMFPYYQGPKSGFALDYDDILAVYEQYGG